MGTGVLGMDRSHVQTCRRCGLKRSSDYEHESDCHNLCTSNTKKMRSYEEIRNRMTLLQSRKLAGDFIEYSVLQWVVGEIDL